MKRGSWILLFLLLAMMGSIAGCDRILNASAPGEASAQIKTMTLGGKSMEPALPDGTKVKVDLNAYASAVPQRGDIIAFQDDRNAVIIKRVVGLPGETVEIREHKLFINGAELKEDYLNAPDSTEPFEGTSLWQVPESSVFVLSDNRPNGSDSRKFGCIAYDKIMGKVLE